MLHTFNGLPAHVLLIHVIVVFIPLGAAFTILSAVWPKARRKLGFLSPLACLIALIFVPIAVNAGEWYQDYLDKQAGQEIPSIAKHADLGHSMLWFAIGLFVFSAAVYLIGRVNDRAADADSSTSSASGSTMTRTRTMTAVPVIVTYAVAVLAVVMSVLAVWWVYRVGDSGAHAVFGGSIQQ